MIETSGLALPQPLVRAFQWPDIRTKLTVDGVVTVVDSVALAEGRFAHDEARLDAQRQADETIDHETPLSELFEDQLACADLVVLNKSDLLDAPALDALSSKLKPQLRQGVRMLNCARGEIAPEVLLGMNIGAEDDIEARGEVHHHHHDDDDGEHEHGHDEFTSFVVDLPAIASPDELAAKIGSIANDHGVLRVKGFATVGDKPMRLVVQAVGPRGQLFRPPAERRGARTLPACGDRHA